MRWVTLTNSFLRMVASSQNFFQCVHSFLMFICRYIFWVSNFLHLLVQYFDYFLCDGSHGFSKHGWKYQPLCIKTSGGWLCPIAAVWALEEETASFLKLVDFCREHCEDHHVDCSAFMRRLTYLANVEVMPFAILLCTH